MAFVCLPPKEVEKFKTALRSGKVDPEKLASMSSAERRAFFETITGKENAQGVNALFESKTLLKNQEQGYVRWAKQVAGITPTARRDILARIAKLDHVLDPKEEGQFLQDLASQKLGVGVTQEEAKNIANLSSKIQETEAKGLSTSEDSLKKGFSLSKNDLDHGYARYDLQKYISDLKNKEKKFRVGDLKSFRGAARAIGGTPRLVADVSKSIGASLDDSFALRQGFKAFFTNNKEWRKQFIQSFANIVKAAKNSEAAQREFKAHIMADPVYDQAVKDGLAVIKHEDVFPTSLPGKIPVAGRAFNASEVAYEAFAENLRLGIYKQQLRLAQGLGEDVPKDLGKNIAKEVNSLTGRGGLGKLEPVSGPANLAFYSLRFLKSNVDTLLLHPAGVGIGGLGSKAQIKAATNLVKIIAGTAAILKTADALKPGSVQWDPRSTDFGQIKIGDTRFNVSGGMNSIITLAARVATQSTKTGNGVATKLNTGGYGAPTEADIVKQFFENKLSPVAGVISDKLEGQTPAGQKPTPRSESEKLVTPLNVNNFTELKNDKNSANILASMLADTFGISTNTYGKSTTNWSTNPGKELQAFQKKVGDKQFQTANQKYNQQLDTALKKLTSSPVYKSMPDDQKNSTLTSLKAKVKKDVLNSYNFKYKAPTANKAASKTRNQLVKSST